MGDRYVLILNCAYCNSRNDDVWYAPTCSSDTFACEKCGKNNFIIDSAFGFKAKKVEDVKYEEVKIGFLNTTNVNWTDEQVERMCKERYDSLNTRDDTIEQLKQEKEKLLEKQKNEAEIKKIKKEIFILKNPIFVWIGGFTKKLVNIAGNLGDNILGETKKREELCRDTETECNAINSSPKKEKNCVGTQKPSVTHNSSPKKEKNCVGTQKPSVTPSPPKEKNSQKPSEVSGILNEMDKAMKNIDKSIGEAQP